MDPLIRLVNIEEIKVLKARYFRLMDTKQWKHFGELFTEDAMFEDLAPTNVFRAHGRDEIIRVFPTVLGNIISVHRGYLPEITIHDDERAFGIWGMQDQLRYRTDADDYTGPATTFETGSGHYHDEYRKVDGAWRIHRSSLSRLECETTRRGANTT